MNPGVTLSYCSFIIDFLRSNATKLGCMSVFLTTITPAYADQFDTLNYIGSVAVDYDDNIYRLPSGADPQSLIGKSTKSDLIKIATLGINLDKKYSNQEVTFNATGSVYKYTNFTDLDYTSSSFKGGWNWQFTPRFSGSLNASRVETLNNPGDTKVFTRNLSTADSVSLKGDWWIHSNWHLLVSSSHGKTSNSVNTVNNLSTHNDSNELGVKYDHSNGKSIVLISRYLKAYNSNQTPDPVQLLDTGSNERQLDLQLSWELSGKSTLSGDLQYADHRNFNYSQRNYNGFEGGLNYELGISDKTTINMSFQRNLISWWDNFNSYYVSDNFSISPTWQLSAKRVLRMSISHGINEYHEPVFSGGNSRHDVTESIKIGYDWIPQRAVTLSASVQRNKRTSTPTAPVDYSGYGFIENSVLLSAQAYF